MAEDAKEKRKETETVEEKTRVPDPWRFNTDPDPQIRTYHWITAPEPATFFSDYVFYFLLR
jgi:hypothetical protein